MEIRESANSKDFERYNTEEIRREFLIDKLFETGAIHRVYSNVDRVITMGAMPTVEPLNLEDQLNIWETLGVNSFLERRELGMINIGGPAEITVDDQVFELKSFDGLYIGMETKKVLFKALDPMHLPKLYMVSTPAHKVLPAFYIDVEKAKKVPMGDEATSNKRVIYQYLHPEVLETCQLMMGLTRMAAGSVWNTMPVHTHLRRMEVYMYFDVAEDQLVWHFMGKPNETRHVAMRNEQAIISPSWSIHSGSGTSSYSFIWAMAGENKTFTDMDHIAMKDLK